MKLATIALAVAFDLPTIFAIAEGSLNYSTPAARPVISYSIHTFRKPTLLQRVSRIRALGHQVLPQSKQVTLMTHIFRRAD